MLPDEKEVAEAIATEHAAELAKMTALHDAVLAMMMADKWTVTKLPLVTASVTRTMVGLLTKACKTFRCIQILCERGFHNDANSLVRVLMETMVAVILILQKKSDQRARMYHAHSIAQSLKMLKEWKKTPGLKQKATKKMMQQTTDTLAAMMKKLPIGTDVSKHWSGPSGFRGACAALRHDTLYATLFRLTSSTSHASDLSAHVAVDPASDEFVYQLFPKVQGFHGPSFASRELLWHMANRIDQRLGLGFAGTLAPHKLNKSELPMPTAKG